MTSLASFVSVRTTRGFTLLPLVFLALMMALGLAIEAVGYGVLLWETKIPLAVLLAFAFLKDGRPRSTSSSSR